jgi:Tol biopolymer transport system component
LDVSEIDAATPVGGPQKTIAYASNRTGNYDIYLLDVATGRSRRITREKASDNSPAWSPDGTKLAFSSRLGGVVGIFIMNADGTGVTRMTRSPDQDSAPSWQP